MQNVRLVFSQHYIIFRDIRVMFLTKLFIQNLLKYSGLHKNMEAYNIIYPALWLHDLRHHSLALHYGTCADSNPP